MKNPKQITEQSNIDKYLIFVYGVTLKQVGGRSTRRINSEMNILNNYLLSVGGPAIKSVEIKLYMYVHFAIYCEKLLFQF